MSSDYGDSDLRMPGTGLFRSSTASPAVYESVTSKESGNTLRGAGLSLDDKWGPIGSALFLYFLSVCIVETFFLILLFKADQEDP